jgi:hypothetical protein
MNFKGLFFSICILLLMSCTDATEQLNLDYGSPQTRDRLLDAQDPLAIVFNQDVLPILEKRCVVCHGCYDAPCQLKLSSPQGIDRGASAIKVFDAKRLLASQPSRLFIDATSSEEWRRKGFSAVLNERDQTLLANLQGSILYQMLLQKNKNPQPTVGRLPDKFNYVLDGKNQCPTNETYEQYQEDFPLAGMPYGLPALNHNEFRVLEQWVGLGAPMSKPIPLQQAILDLLVKWESKLNGNSVKQQLINRYIYEHLFLAHLYFEQVNVEEGKQPVFFRLVRSISPPGQPIKEVTTRRPYEDPKSERVYYRFKRELGVILSKTHMPYALNEQREKRWDQLFYELDFEVDNLPDYRDPSPFIVFQAIPSSSRYSFMLDEAFFTINSFIKGPVCRGNVAVNVINDHFWVFFANPLSKTASTADAFILQQAENLRLPAEASSQTFSIADWLSYSRGQVRYINAKSEYINNKMDLDRGLLLSNVWSGNENAALTVFRHVDNATVLKGSIGKQPKTAWIIDYPVLERIHYLLIAGFDVFGNIGHQVKTRLYMDFLRIESEMNFVSLLPNKNRKEVMNSWYLDASSELSVYLNDNNLLHSRPSGVNFQTPFVKEELMTKLKQHVYHQDKQKNTALKHAIPAQDQKLKRLHSLGNSVVRTLPEVSFIIIESDKETDRVYTLLRHNAHKNISSLLNEKANRLPELDTAEIYKGLIGNYPDLIFNVHERDMQLFVNQFVNAQTSARFVQLLDQFSVRRTNPDFWKISDKLHQLHFASDPVAYGLFDYNRLENR